MVMMVSYLVLLSVLFQSLCLQGYSLNATLPVSQKHTDHDQLGLGGESFQIQSFPYEEMVTGNKSVKVKTSLQRQSSKKRKKGSGFSSIPKSRMRPYSADTEGKRQTVTDFPNDHVSYQGTKRQQHNLKLAFDQNRASNTKRFANDIDQFKINLGNSKPHESFKRTRQALETNKLTTHLFNTRNKTLRHLLNGELFIHQPEFSSDDPRRETIPVMKQDNNAEDNELPDDAYKFVYRRPVDHYRCDVCSCHKTANETVHADCSYRRMKHPPVILGYNIEHLDLSHNRFEPISFTPFSKYKSLQTLDLSSNPIYLIESLPLPCNFTTEVRHLDLSNNRIRKIGSNGFSCFPKLESLKLNGNKLLNVSNETFTGIPNLLYLNLSKNNFNLIDSRSFDHLGNILTLDLSRNTRLDLSAKSFRPRTFMFLKALKILHMQDLYNDKHQYPTSSFAQMISMAELHVDGGGNLVFDSNMRNLTHLTTLKIGYHGKCRKMNFTDSFFINMPHLTSIEVDGCSIVDFSEDLYKPVPLLQKLVFSHILYPFNEFFTQHLAGLKNSSLKSFTVSQIFDPVFLPFYCRSLTAAHVKHLTNLSSLEELRIENSKISLINQEFIEGLPVSLRHISLSGNYLMSFRGLLKRGSHLINLISLDETAQSNSKSVNSVSDFSHYSFAQNISHDTCSCSSCTQNYWDNPTMSNGPYYLSRKKIALPSKEDLPPNLQHYSAAYSIHFGRPLLLPRLKNSSVRNFNISNTYTSLSGNKYLFQGIEIADFSKNAFDTLTNHLFRMNNSLKELHMAGNYIGNDLSTDVGGVKFSRLKNVVYLDLSRNQIRELPSDIFKGLINVKVLLLSRNNIHIFNVSLAHMKSLLFLDLSMNSISWIGKESRDALDLISLDHEVTIDLTSNPLPCTCNGIEILKWLGSTRVRVINKDFLECVDSANKKRLIGDLSKRASGLQRSCLSKAYITSISISVVAVFFIITCSVLLFRNRWKLYYIKNIMINKYYGFKPNDAVTQYKFDAYFLYVEDDRRFVLRECVRELEEERGHKLCIEDRDFLPGSFVPSNITSAIQNSSVTIPVISPDFWNGEWTEYGLQMSVMEAISSKRRVLHLLLYKDVPIENMSADLIKVHNDNNFTEYPPMDCNEDVKKTFWDSLSRIIGHTANPEENPQLEL